MAAKAIEPSGSSEQIATIVKSMTKLPSDRAENSEEEEKAREADQKLAEIAKQMANEGRIKELHDAFIASRNALDSLTNARASKEALCVESIDWAKASSRLYLYRTLRSRLIRLYNDIGKNAEAIKIAGELSKELKKVDDKELIIEVALEESRAAFALNNFSKAKTALASARTVSHGFYTSATMQAQLDLQSGMLYAADDRDFKTGYSYFFEAFEGFVQIADKERAALALKYMCLTKVMLNESEHIRALLETKACQRFLDDKNIVAIVEMANAFKNRSLALFQKCLETYPVELGQDPVVRGHSHQLHESMLEKEISRIVEPYSTIDMKHISDKVKLPVDRIEKKLATMILDQKLRGVIYQKEGSLVILPPLANQAIYRKSNDLIRALGKVIDACQQSTSLLLK